MRKTSLVLAMLLAVAGICVMLWPIFAGYKLQTDTNTAVQSFLEEQKPEQQYLNCWQSYKPTISVSTLKNNLALLTSKLARNPPSI